MSALTLTISDLFFNSEEIRNTDTADERNILESAKEWLSNYPYFKQFISADELTKDFLRRL
jgi:hypothetical protein